MTFDYGSSTIPVGIDPTAWAGRTNTPTAPLDFKTIQEALVAQLQAELASASLSSIEVFSFPDLDLDAWWAGSTIAYVLIVYDGTTWSKPKDTNAMLQDRELEFSVHISARQAAWAITGLGGVSSLIDYVQAALLGLRIKGCKNTYFREERFDTKDAEGGIWDFALRLIVPTQRIKQEPVYALANLVRAVAVEANAQTTIMTAAAEYTFSSSGIIQLPVTFMGDVAIKAINGTRTYTLGTDFLVSQPLGQITVIPTGALGPDVPVLISYTTTDQTVAVYPGGSAPEQPTN